MFSAVSSTVVFYTKHFMGDKRRKRKRERKWKKERKRRKERKKEGEWVWGGAVMEEHQTRSVCLPYCMTTPLFLPFSLTFSLASHTVLSLCLSFSPSMSDLSFFCSSLHFCTASKPWSTSNDSNSPPLWESMQLNELQGGRKEGHIETFSLNPVSDNGPKQIFSQHY